MKPRVLLVGTEPEGKGGIASVLKIYISSSLSKDFQIRYLVTHTEGTRIRKALIFSKSLAQLLVLLFARKIDVLHIHTSRGMSFIRKALVFWIAKVFDRKLVLHLHSGEFLVFYQSAPKILKILIKTTFEFADRVVVLSPRWKNEVLAFSPSAKVVSIYNPVVIEPHPEFLGRHGFLYLGKICAKKGFWDLLEAFQLAISEVPDIVLTYGGNGDLDEATRRIHFLGLESHVRYLGWISGEEKVRCFREHAVFVLPSYNEGLPMGVLEAMGYGMAIIATPVGGVPDIIADGVNGLLIPRASVSELTEALKRLHRDADLCRTLGIAAQRTAQSKFVVQVVIPQVAALYESVFPTKEADR